MSGVEIVWKFVEYLLVALGVSIYWILEHHKEKQILTKLLFSFIDKNKGINDHGKIGLIQQLARACKLSGVDIQRYVDEYIKKYDPKK